MKICLLFDIAEGNVLRLKQQHQYQIQAMVYNLLDKEYARFLHNEGFI
jgi:CRISPR-associated endoribonuclease Cas6